MTATASLASTTANAYRAPKPGQAVLLLDTSYAGTVTRMSTESGRYFHVHVARKEDPRVAVTATVWQDAGDFGRWVVDYRDGEGYVEARRARTLIAALCVAEVNASERGHEAGLW